MLSSNPLELRRQVLTGDGCALWAMTHLADRQRYGRTAVTRLSLTNTGQTPLHLETVEVSCLLPCLQREAIEPHQSLTVLDERSLNGMVSRARQQGRRGFGVSGVVYNFVFHLNQPKVQQLSIQVFWGFATASHDMGFFVLALADEENGPDSSRSFQVSSTEILH